MLRARLLRSAQATAPLVRSRWIHATRVSAEDFVPSRNQLPEHPLQIGNVQASRLREHYERTLAPDMLYMMYDPMPETKKEQALSQEDRVRRWEGDSPYFANRSARPQRGNRPLLPLAKPLQDAKHIEHAIPRLERVVITAFCRDAITNKQALLPLLGQLRAITGLPVLGSQADPTVGNAPETAKLAENGYVQVLRAKKGVASFKLRPGMPVGAQAVLYGDAAYQFIEVLTTFVLPRLRGFAGLPLPPASQPLLSPAAVSGVVSFGMGPEALPLFPQVEVNLDQYPGRRHGMQIDCVTNQRGRRATERARTLLSGLGLPFVRRGTVAL
ncbi:54S ribosomal protein L7, mitochondrial [Malassezia brasiliensis]|uniref:54S ribosomal protein L7, mitochondrial n=1 Tax=Malassezia brasiliensis TaxID=1821822 RepID=A0AAF0IU87_9BASI|nr:54S ribosomal protein L7, mitochondrial [Malassezia brasiliensis]